MKFRKPELIPLLFIIAATVLLAGLGSWQAARLQWKNELIAQIEAAQAEPERTRLPPVLEGIDYRNVSLKGTYMNAKTLHMVGGKHGLPAGFYLFTPFKLAGDGRVILVNRGFAPKGMETDEKGPQTVRGVIRPAREKRFFTPENHPDKNLWFYEDIPAMAETIDVKLLPMVIEAAGERRLGTYPIPGSGRIELRNDHLGYAITWFSLALVGLIMFALYYREDRQP